MQTNPEALEAVAPKLILAIDALRTSLDRHDGNRPDCVHCRIFDHINAAYGEAVGEPIAAMPSRVAELEALLAEGRTYVEDHYSEYAQRLVIRIDAALGASHAS